MFDDLRSLYQEIILDHSKAPRNRRALLEATHIAHGHNPLCGDKLVLYIDVGADGYIHDVAFQGEGCAISTASASLLTQALIGKSLAEAHALYHWFHHLCTQDPPFPSSQDITAAHPPSPPPTLAKAQSAAALEEAQERLLALAGVKAFPARVKCATLAWHTLEAALAGHTHASTEQA
jgi:nitrogen fixation protein NifU and related proteins